VGFARIALHGVGAAELKMRESGDGLVPDATGMVNNPMKLGRRRTLLC